MTEFKQIVGRGTRIHEDTKKYYFTLIDFRKATNHFADPDFDGDPVQIYEPGPDDPITPPDPPPDDGEPVDDDPGDEVIVDRGRFASWDPTEGTRRGRSMSTASRSRSSPNGSSTSTASGKLVTESLRDFTKKELRKHFASLDDFLARWKGADRKQAILDELDEEGLPLDALAGRSASTWTRST